ncbi:hypothetical protein N0V85_003118 [Neurospora sp. IMI 360204]|nr:hypothetical protein N0V85_003118 [Neurospora sp. IMI 360204]
MSKTPHLPDVRSSQPDHLPVHPPPSYTEAIHVGPSSSRSTTSPTIGAGESPLTTHLRTLPSRLRSAQHARSTTQSLRDAFLVAQCVPYIERFIEQDVVNLNLNLPQLPLKTPRLTLVAELVLVPTEGLPGGESSGKDMEEETSSEAGRELARKREARDDKGWELGGGGAIKERMVKVVCVSVAAAPEQVQVVNEKGSRPVDLDQKKDSGSGSGSGSRSRDYSFDGEWGRFETERSSSSSRFSHLLGPEQEWNWFTTPVLARRIASLLLRPEPTTFARKTVQAAAVEAPPPKSPPTSSKKSSGFGSFFRRSMSSSSSSSSKSEPQTPTPTTERVITPVRDGAMLEEDRITMTVRAEEVTFSRENKFGLWESVGGWGIVVSIKVGRL